MFVKKKKVV